MSEIIYKPYSVICKEWSEICSDLTNAQNKMIEIQSLMTDEYPSNDIWDKYEKASSEYKLIRSKMASYRNTVKQSD